MHTRLLKTLCLIIGLVWLVAPNTSWGQKAEKLTADQTKFFESKIRPVLARECYGCHAAKNGQAKGSLILDTKLGWEEGGDSGPAIVPGELDDSPFWSAINYEDYRMPPSGKLPADVIADFKKWIEMGAPDPRLNSFGKINTTISAEDIEAGREFWSFKQTTNPDVPDVERAAWPKSDIDRFVLAGLESNDLRPSPDADALTVLRRLSLDIIGLPPSSDQIDWMRRNYKKDPDKAIKHIVNSLLDNPAFGERWGRHWLDLARFAESSGKESNLTYPHAWRYRDWVIDSFNDDKPYDKFVQQQIAGDLLPAKTDEAWAHNLVGTGFLALGPKSLNEQNGKQFQLDLVDEQIDVATRVVLGVSVACARCHDHKFDPIRQTDYYAMAGIFENMTTHYGTMFTFQNRRASNLIELPVNVQTDLVPELSRKEFQDLKDQLVEATTKLNEARRKVTAARRTGEGGQQVLGDLLRATSIKGALEAKLNQYNDAGKPITNIMGVQDVDRPDNARLLVRGEFDKPAQEVERGFPEVLCSTPVKIKSKSSGRLELARWMTDKQNPLTARVMVNRIWQHMLGDGLVRTPENFGATGLPPTHPELLDYLANKFVESNWSVKTIVREIAMSRIYRTDSKFDSLSFQKDPENKYLWRVDPKRLDAEVIRDSMLDVSGLLERERPLGSIVARTGDALVRDGVLITASAPSSENMGGMMMMGGNRRGGNRRNGGDSNRPGAGAGAFIPIQQTTNHRSVYQAVVRDQVPRSLDVFDFAEASMVVGKRESSNTPDQGLFFLNNEDVMKQSDAFAKRLIAESSDTREQIELAFLWAYGRDASKNELKAAADFLREFQPTASRSRFRRADPKDQYVEKLSAFCQSIFGSAEFRFLN